MFWKFLRSYERRSGVLQNITVHFLCIFKWKHILIVYIIKVVVQKHVLNDKLNSLAQKMRPIKLFLSKIIISSYQSNHLIWYRIQVIKYLKNN